MWSEVVRGNIVNSPAGASRQILLGLPKEMNQRLPSGPAVMPPRLSPSIGVGNKRTSPVSVMRPIVFGSCSVNQIEPSGPSVRSPGFSTENSAMVAAAEVGEGDDVGAC